MARKRPWSISTKTSQKNALKVDEDLLTRDTIRNKDDAMKYLLFSLISFSSFASAPMYDLNIKVKNGDTVMTPKFMVKNGETATVIRDIDGKENFVDVTTIKETDGYHLKFKIGSIVNGDRFVEATPEMHVKENKMTDFLGSNDSEIDGGNNVTVSVLAKEVIEEEQD